jgi:hypothetical protein
MRAKLTAVVVTAVFCAGVAMASGGQERPLVLRGASATPQLLGLHYGRLDTWLVRLEPRTLETLPGRKLALGRYQSGWSFSPDRSRIVFGNQGVALNDSPAALRIVDPAKLGTIRDVPLGMDGYVAATHWVGPDRLQAVVRSSSPEGDFALLVDAAEGRVLQRQLLEGSVSAIGRAKGALVLLLESPTFGPIGLAVADEAGSVRSVKLDRIEAGRSVTDPPNSYLQHDRAGLAVDAAGGRAYVVAAGDPVAEVDLASLSVAYHVPSQPVSLLGRLHDWAEPRARAKEFLTRSARGALWLGDGQLAVVGMNGTAHWTKNRFAVKMVPSGLQVIDTRDWSSRVVDPSSSDLEVARNALLSWGSSWDSGTQKGTGLTVFGSHGERRFHLFGAQRVYGAQVVNGRAFVLRQAVEPGYAIVSLRTGKVLRTIRGRYAPALLDGPGAPFYG